VSFKVLSIMTIPVVINKEGFRNLDVELIEQPASTEEEIISVASDADALIVANEPISKRVITKLRSCRLISTPKMGYDNIDLLVATEKGICVSAIPDLSVEEVSEHVIALLLACTRKVVRLDNMIREGKWRFLHGGEMQEIWHGITPLMGKTMGLIGFGRVSRALVPKARGFGLRILAHDPYVSGDVFGNIGVETVGLNRLLKESDYVSIHSTLTNLNRHMLGLEQFKLMKNTAYLINTARGALVDEEALYIALSQGYIAGAGLDVLEVEPVKMNNPLLKLDNVVLTGHSAHYSDRAWMDVSLRASEDVARIISGDWPRGWINPQVEAKFIARWGKNK
jgi:D-3-phosphoglycerate dehydrogenase